ncbi:Type 1 glutamine amidotransferase-like domain-containing protein [Streptomyces sp. SID13031]|uniref:Type 1 glutamine amidotransferase-like domain-containing protein n=1 Tax=Streptomyces sp. SID13031 TaxID=2706046 RepID=UPI0013CCD2D7|nr:Type 1 glutamine amidotransferase-like domain-containing protein [Streptomyces sp. SID13031]NEA34511.1 type 1 glutamine amidotransferase-like domain-containing protein [Streptomyces sp. SID13031]
MTPPQILATSGVLEGDRSRTLGLIRYAVSLAAVPGQARLCFIPTAEGDNPLALEWFEQTFGNDPAIAASVLTLFTSPNVPDLREHLLAQDVVWVGGGSVVNLMAVWRAHGLYRQLVADGALPSGYASKAIARPRSCRGS